MGVGLISRLGARVSGQRGAATTTEAVLHVHIYKVGRGVGTGQEKAKKLYMVALSVQVRLRVSDDSSRI
jgi:hypothetical protein